MNLQEWLNSRKNCPLCEAPLTTYLHSTKKQSIKWESGRMVVVFPLHRKGQIGGYDYKVGYSFDLTNNNFSIEFYDKDGLRIEKAIAPHLMDKFKALDKNLKTYRFYRKCNGCQKYHYSSGVFRLDLKTATLRFRDGLFVSSEYFGLIQAMERGSKTPYRIYRVLNIYDPGPDITKQHTNYGTHLTYWNAATPNGVLSDQTIPNEAAYLNLPLIPFVSSDDTLERIKKLLVFS